MDFTVFILPTLLVLLGFLALTLPRRFNPFQLKRTYAKHAPENIQNTAPKVIGWILLGIGTLWILGLIALLVLFKFTDSRSSNRSSETAKENARMEREAVDIVNQAIQNAESYSILSKRGIHFITSAQTQTAQLTELRNLLQVSPREDTSQALFIVPNLVINFEKNGKPIAQIKLGVQKIETAYYAMDIAGKHTVEGTLSTASLMYILSQYDDENLRRVLNAATQSGGNPTPP